MTLSTTSSTPSPPIRTAAASRSGSAPRRLVVTACSARKSVAGPSITDVLRPWRHPTHEAAARAWTDALAAQHRFVSARDLYTGRAFRISAEAADRARADLAVASCGLGLVAGGRIPGYDCTLSREGPSPSRSIADFDAQRWWTALCDTPFSEPDPAAHLAGYDEVLAPLSAGYLRMCSRMFEDARLLNPSLTIRLFCSTDRVPSLAIHAVPKPPNLSEFRDGPYVDEAARRLLHFVTTAM